MSEVQRYHVQIFKLSGEQQKYAHGALGAVEVVRASDFDAHVTRLQAENAALQQRMNVADQRNDEMQSELTIERTRADVAVADCNDAERKLIKTRELFGAVWQFSDRLPDDVRDRILAFLTNQSAPAACWAPTNHECPGDGVGACKNCPNIPPENFIACKVDESCGLGGGNGTDE